MRANTERHQGECDLELLLAAAGCGDRAAFRRLYSATSPKLYAVLIRILRNENEAADTLQEVYISVWRRAASFDPAKGRALTWLAVIARNAGIDALRRRKPGTSDDEACAEIADDGASPFDSIRLAHASRALIRGLEGLPQNQQDAIRFFYLEDMSLNEVAGRMHAPLNTTKSWIRRGLKRLQTDFSDQALADFV